MPTVSHDFSDQFHRWEQRTRGHLVFPHPVTPEPPFVAFPGHRLRKARDIDDGRRPTHLSSLVQRFWSKPSAPVPEEPEEEQAPTLFEREPLIEFPLLLPADFDPRKSDGQNFIRSLAVCQEPVAFELIGTVDRVTAQIVVSAADQEHLQQQLQAVFPEVVSVPSQGKLEAAWGSAGPVAAVVELGLANESVRLLAGTDHDLFVAMVGAMSDFKSDELGAFQVIWQPVTEKWSESLVRSVTDNSGKAFFVNAPELADAARRKTSLPLYAAVLRLAACSSDIDRTWEILRKLASGFQSFSNPNGNELVPLHNDGYPYDAHVEDFVRRQSRRSGMLLNADEFVGFVHLPSSAVRSKKFLRQLEKSKPAPISATREGGLLLGINEHAGQRREVRLTADQRVRHMHVVGASGTGKSTLLFNLIRQDIESGQGVGVLDPHGDLIDRILGIIPSSRMDDVVLLDPGDEEFSVGFNILSAHSELEKNLLASDLVSVFQRLSTSWGDQMGVVLNNAIRAFLESDKGGTLADLRRFLLEPAFRNHFLNTVRDPDIVYYWKVGFAQLSGNKSIGPVMTRLETFLSPKPIRYMVSQAQNRLDFAQILDGGKIFLAKLSQGAIGRENSSLLGSLLMAKFQQVVMSRQSQQEANRRDFWLYLDEFHNFITPSTAEILTGARKYHLGLALAHQELRQLQRDSEVASTVLASPYTRICFRVGDQDARTLASGFTLFEARDLQNLSTGQAVCRVERADYDFNLTVSLPEMPADDVASERRRQAVMASREKYAMPRAAVEAEIRARAEASDPRKPETAAAKAKPVEASPAEPQESAVPAEKTAIPTNAPPPIPEDKPVRVKKPRPTAPAIMGLGGAQCIAVRNRIEQCAIELGFGFAVEVQVFGGAGKVDFVLSRTGQTLACELSVTQTIDYEVGNVAKCIAAGFKQIVMIAVSEAKLRNLETAIRNSLGAESAAFVSFFLPDAFLAYLRKLPPPKPVGPEVKKVLGYNKKTTYDDDSPEGVKATEDRMIRLMGEIVRRKKKP